MFSVGASISPKMNNVSSSSSCHMRARVMSDATLEFDLLLFSLFWGLCRGRGRWLLFMEISSGPHKEEHMSGCDWIIYYDSATMHILTRHFEIRTELVRDAAWRSGETYETIPIWRIHHQRATTATASHRRRWKPKHLLAMITFHFTVPLAVYSPANCTRMR